MQFTTKSGCNIALTETPEGDTLMSMHVEHGGKGLATATVANAPDGSKVILGTHASVKLDPESRAALRAALEEPLELKIGSGTPMQLADIPHEEDVARSEYDRIATEILDEHGYRPKEGALVPTSDVHQMLTEALKRSYDTASDEYDWVLRRQSQILHDAANALRGTPPSLTTWSVHDVADLAKAAVEIIARQTVFDAGLEWDAVTPENQEHYRTQARAEIQAVEL